MSGSDDEEAGFVEQDDEQERQQAHRGEEESDRDRLVIAAVEVMRGRVQSGERQPEHQQRPGHAPDRVVPPVGREVEEAPAHEQEGAEIERDLRVGERPALDDPVVLAGVEGAIRRVQAFGLMRVDQLQTQPLADLLHVRGDAHAERGGVDRRTGVHRQSVEIAPQVGAELER